VDIAGYKIIVTGGASGMGAATVRTYVAAGATVVSMDVSEDAGRAVVEAANTSGPGSATFMRVDIADKASVDTAFETAVAQLGGLDAVAHPAAIQRAGDAASVTVADWDLLFAVDVRGTMLVNQAAYRHMAAQKRGSIINFGSVSGLRAEPVAPAYSAAKGAVHSWTRTAAAAWGADGVRVNAILPAIATPMYDTAIGRLDEAGRTAHFWQNEQSIALGQKYGDADRDLGPVMVFLASESSRFITGQLLPVDGGQSSVR
jgi:NAD(P)-dependent dehydrogenase (short-subunit alcohol dehydrogenase family)